MPPGRTVSVGDGFRVEGGARARGSSFAPAKPCLGRSAPAQPVVVGEHAGAWVPPTVTFRRAASCGLVLLAFLLPFELTRPVVEIPLPRAFSGEAGTLSSFPGPVRLSITNVELLLYGILVLWVAGRLRGGPRTERTGVHAAACAWGAALVVSAAFASVERGEAFKFALRGLGGVGLLFAASAVASTPRVRRAIAFAAAAGAVVSAMAGVLESLVPGEMNVLLAFKAATASLGGFVRASGTLQYPTTAAMYWEATLPFVFVAGVLLASRRPAWRWAAAAAVLVVVTAVALTLSRAAVAVTAAMMLAAALAGPGRETRRAAVAALAVLAGLALGIPAARGRLGLSGATVAGTSWHRAEYRPQPRGGEIGSGESVEWPLRVRNAGPDTWPADGPRRVAVCHDWVPAGSAESAVLDVRCTPLTLDVGPGRDVELRPVVVAPGRPGRYVLRWHLVGSGIVWGSARHAPSDTALDVGPAPPGGSTAAPAGSLLRVPVQKEPTRLELWRAGLRMWTERPWFGVGPDNFRRLYAGHLGPKALDERTRSNSLYVETLATLGAGGALALAGLAAALVVALRSRLRAADAEDRLVRLGAAAGLGAFFVHGLVDDFLAATPTYGLFWLLAALACAPPGGAGRADADRITPGPSRPRTEGVHG
jgi:hypothetical protein